MAAPGIPTGFYAQTGNIQNFCSWSISVGATSYSVQRSTDGVTYSVVATPATNYYLDTDVSIGVKYFYRVASTNGDGTSGYTAPQDVIPAPTSEMALGQLRYLCQARADRVGSNFVTLPEWNSFINLAQYELYDLLIKQEPDAFMAPRALFPTVGNTFIYPLPNGIIEFQDSAGDVLVAQSFYKLLGVDLAVNASSNAFVTLNKYSLIDRNRYVYPNSQSTIYGVYDLQYRLMGNNIEFIPPPSANQLIQLLYIPRLTQLLQDTDVTTIGYSGWLDYIIVRAAKYALDKEESDTGTLDQELLFLKERIENSAMNRDVGQPDCISDTRRDGGSGGWNGPSGGW